MDNYKIGTRAGHIFQWIPMATSCLEFYYYRLVLTSCPHAHYGSEINTTKFTNKRKLIIFWQYVKYNCVIDDQVSLICVTCHMHFKVWAARPYINLNVQNSMWKI